MTDAVLTAIEERLAALRAERQNEVDAEEMLNALRLMAAAAASGIPEGIQRWEELRQKFIGETLAEGEISTIISLLDAVYMEAAANVKSAAFAPERAQPSSTGEPPSLETNDVGNSDAIGAAAGRSPCHRYTEDAPNGLAAPSAWAGAWGDPKDVPLPAPSPESVQLYGPTLAAAQMRNARGPEESPGAFAERVRKGRQAARAAERWAENARPPDPDEQQGWMA
jgi:hypothetical protein